MEVADREVLVVRVERPDGAFLGVDDLVQADPPAGSGIGLERRSDMAEGIGSEEVIRGKRPDDVPRAPGEKPIDRVAEALVGLDPDVCRADQPGGAFGTAIGGTGVGVEDLHIEPLRGDEDALQAPLQVGHAVTGRREHRDLHRPSPVPASVVSGGSPERIVSATTYNGRSFPWK